MKKIFGMPLALAIIGLLVIGGATAALLQVYVNITGDTQVDQSVVLMDGESATTSADYSFAGGIYAGGEYSETFTLKNRADTSESVEIETVCTPTNTAGCGGISWDYYELQSYTEEYLAEDTILDRTNITMQVTDEYVIWTLSAPSEYTTYGEGIGPGGQVEWSISIGEGSDILYQIHNNGGTDSSYDFGTYLYSEYDDGWQTGTSNTLVSEIDGIEATGEHTDLVHTIKISKDKLPDKQFKWVAYVNQETDSLPADFSWGDTNTTNFFTTPLSNEITGPITLQPGQEYTFESQFTFDAALEPDTFNIETKVVPE